MDGSSIARLGPNGRQWTPSLPLRKRRTHADKCTLGSRGTSPAEAATALAEALCSKRFRVARDAMLAVIDRNSVGSDSFPFGDEDSGAATFAIARLNPAPLPSAAVLPAASALGFTTSMVAGTHRLVPMANDIGLQMLPTLQPPQRSTSAWSCTRRSMLRLPLGPAPTASVDSNEKISASMQHESLWEVTRHESSDAVSGPSKATLRRSHMGYLEYLTLLHRVLPESMRPSDNQDNSYLADSTIKSTNDSMEQLSGLELLRALGKVAAPKVVKKTGLPPLTDEERAIAEDALGDGKSSEVLVSRFNVELTRGQVQCLLPGTWLNDEVINLYFKLLQERSNSQKDHAKCWFANSFFWPKLSGASNSNYSYKDVKRWTTKAKIDIFAIDYVIFPMNIGESHWALGVIDFKEKGFRYFDSMFANPHRNFVPFLQKYLNDEHAAKKKGSFSGVESWELIKHVDKPPQQRNGYDCGVFTCMFGDFFSAQKSMTFGQDDMPDIRLKIAARVVKCDETSWDG